MADEKTSPERASAPSSGWQALLRRAEAPVRIPYLGPIPTYYLLLAVLFILYILTKAMLVGLLAGLLMVAIVVYEFALGVREGGWKNELIQTALAVLLAVVVWFGAGFVLQTETPINAIVSCSMRPAYERGDLVLLAGGVPHAPIFQYSGPAQDINASAQVSVGNTSWAVNGSWLAYCSTHLREDGRCQAFVRAPEAFVETHGPLRLHYATCIRQDAASGQDRSTSVCVNETWMSGQRVPFDPADELIVYTPKSGDLYSRVGDIVHRARLAINTTDGIVYLTKGDNNPVYDLQAYDESSGMGNSPVRAGQIRGHVWLRVPYLGNLKLFITPAVLTDASSLSGCDSHYAAAYR